MFVLLVISLLAILFIFLKSVSVKRPLTVTLIIGFFVSSIVTTNLWFNYRASLGEQDGIAISNKVSYWLITDEVRWTTTLFMDVFNISLIITFLIPLVIIVGNFAYKRRKLA